MTTEATSSVRTQRLSATDGLTSISSSSTASSTIFYSPRNPNDLRAKTRAAIPRFPTPHIRPRQRRPHSIHIVSYPAGYIPYELRSAEPDKKKTKKRRITGTDRPASPTERTAKRVWETLLAPFACNTSRDDSPVPEQRKRPSTATPSLTSSGVGSTSSRFENQHQHQRHRRSLSMTRASTMVEAPRPPVVGADSTSISLHNKTLGIINTRALKAGMTSRVTEIPKPIASGSGVNCSILLAEPNLFLTGFDHDGRNRGQPHPNSTALLRGKLQLNVSKNVKIKSVTLKLSGKARTEWPEGIPPTKTELFEETSLRTQVLTFFHALHDDWETPFGNQCVAHLKTPSPNATPPGSTSSLVSLFGGVSYSASASHLPNAAAGPKPTPKELKRLSLQSLQAMNYNKDMSLPGIRPSAQVAKGFKVFHPGTYEYSFELPIDHHQLETTKLPFGSVKWELETIVERAGAFKPNLHGAKEVSIVRVPDQLSLETTEPIVIGRQWEDQLHYEIMISGKSFPVGSRIPVAFKLTPLAKVQVHKLKVFVTESVEYWTNDKKVTRKDQGRKILLLEKSAGKPLDQDKYRGCDVRVLSGGELGPEERQEAIDIAARRRSEEGESSSLQAPADNMLGDLDLGLESFWGSTEIEMNVQIPTCDMMRKDRNLKLNPDCSWKNVNVFHWIKIVMRISRVDEEDPTRQRRRHFEISIDSPITLLNCRATQANTSLPLYLGPTSSPVTFSPSHTAECGCPDAGQMSAADITSLQLSTQMDTTIPRPIHFMRKPSFTPPAFDAEDPPPPISPLLGHANTFPISATSASAARPSRLVIPARLEPSEPPMMTPPPCYDAIVGTPSVDGMADYFARLADYQDDDGDSSSSDGGDSTRPARLIERSGRVNVANPMSPGGMAFGEQLVPSRSLELQRPILLTLPEPPRRHD